MSFIQRPGQESSPTHPDNTKEFKFATLRFIPPTTYESAKKIIEDLMLQATIVLMQKAMHFEDDYSWEMYSESLDAYQSAGQHLQRIAEEMENKRRFLTEEGNISKAKLAEATAARAWTLLCNCALNLEAMDSGILVAQWPKWHEDVELVRIAANKTFTAAQSMGKGNGSLPSSNLLLKDTAEHPSPRPAISSVVDTLPMVPLVQIGSPPPVQTCRPQYNAHGMKPSIVVSENGLLLPPKTQRERSDVSNNPPGANSFPTNDGLFTIPAPSSVHMSPVTPTVKQPRVVSPGISKDKQHHTVDGPSVIENEVLSTKQEREDPHYIEIKWDSSKSFDEGLIKPDVIIEPTHEEQQMKAQLAPQLFITMDSIKENNPPIRRTESLKGPVRKVAEKSLWDLTSEELAELENFGAKSKIRLQEIRNDNIQAFNNDRIEASKKETPREASTLAVSMLQSPVTAPAPIKPVSTFTYSPERPDFVPKAKCPTAAGNVSQQPAVGKGPDSPEWAIGEAPEAPCERSFSEESYDELAGKEEFSFSLPARIVEPKNIDNLHEQIANNSAANHMYEIPKSNPVAPRIVAPEAPAIPKASIGSLEEQKKRLVQQFQNWHARAGGRSYGRS